MRQNEYSGIKINVLWLTVGQPAFSAWFEEEIINSAAAKHDHGKANVEWCSQRK
jgi:hypothetical protein